MKHTIIDCPQGSDSPEWLAARLGLATGSKADCIMANGKAGKPSVQRENYCYELAEQRVTGLLPAPGFISDAMRWGTEQEPNARAAYEAHRLTMVKTTGFIRCDEIMAGCSLDGHVEDSGRIAGIVEIKCPMLKTHIGYLKAGVIPPEYRWQVTHNLLITGAQWCDFISYRPGFQMFVIRVRRDEMPIAEYATALNAFLAEVDECQKDIMRFSESS